jgi:hypothetical protein
LFHNFVVLNLRCCHPWWPQVSCSYRSYY